MKMDLNKLICKGVFAFILSFIATAARAQTVDAYFVTDLVDSAIRVYSVANNQLLITLRSGGSPGQVAVSANNRLAFVTNANSNFASVFDTTIGAEIARVRGPRSAIAVISADGTRVVIPQFLVSPLATISIINTADFSITQQDLSGLLCVGGDCGQPGPSAIVGNNAYFNAGPNNSGSVSGGLVVVDLSGANPPFLVSGTNGSTNGSLLNTTAATPDGQYVIALRANLQTIPVMNSTTNSVFESFPTDLSPSAVAITPSAGAGNGVFAYVLGTDGQGNSVVQAYSVNHGVLTAAARSLPIPGNPNEAALSPDGSRLYLAASQGSSSVTVVDSSNPTVALSQTSLQIGNSVLAVSTGTISLQPPAAAPIVTSVAPQLAVNNGSAANRAVQISGTNFDSALVRFGNLDPLASSTTSSGLAATVPFQGAAQPADIVVTNPGPIAGPISAQHVSGILRGQFLVASPPIFEPANQVLVANGADNTISVLNVSTNAGVSPSTGGFFRVVGVGITPDGGHAYSMDFDPPQVYAYDVVGSQLIATIPINPGTVTAPNGLPALSGQEDPVAVVNSPVTSSAGPGAYVTAGVPLPDNNFDLGIFVVDADPASSQFNQIVFSMQAGIDSPLFLPGGIAVTPDGRYVYANASQSIFAPGWSFNTLIGSIVVFDVVGKTVSLVSAQSLGIAGFQGHIEVSADGKSLLLAATNGGVSVFDIGTNPMSPQFIATMTGSTPAGLFPPTFFEYRFPKNVAHRVVTYDQLQNILAVFYFDRSQPCNPPAPLTSCFAQLGSVVVPGAAGIRDGFGLDVTPDGKLAYALLGEEDDVAVVDTSMQMATVNPSNPALLTKIVTGLSPASLAVRPGTPTPPSASPTDVVNVMPIQGATISLTGSSGGTTTVTTTNTTLFSAPAGFQTSGIPVYYEVATTASFSSAVVCFQYNPAQVPSPESSLRLAHYDSAVDPATGQTIGWTDVTLPDSPNTTTHTICGQVSSFSPFVIGLASADFLFNSLLADISTLSSATTPVGVMRSLRGKALAARASVKRGNDTSAENQLNALINQLQVLSGKQLSPADASILINEANTILSHLTN